MIKNILAVGDSFTYGEELTDRDNAWPQLVANALTAKLDNRAMPGSGNARMIREVVENSTGNDLVLIGWTSPGRIEFADDDGIFDIWPGYNGLKFVNHPWRTTLVDYISKFHDAEYLYKQYLVNVILTQNYLKLNNVKYLMLLTVANEYYKNTFGDKFVDLRNQIDPTYFVDPGSGMAEWANRFPKGPRGHFLDDGHFIVADRVLNKIKVMGWI